MHKCTAKNDQIQVSAGILFFKNFEALSMLILHIKCFSLSAFLGRGGTHACKQPRNEIYLMVEIKRAWMVGFPRPDETVNQSAEHPNSRLGHCSIFQAFSLIFSRLISEPPQAACGFMCAIIFNFFHIFRTRFCGLRTCVASLLWRKFVIVLGIKLQAFNLI